MSYDKEQYINFLIEMIEIGKEISFNKRYFRNVDEKLNILKRNIKEIANKPQNVYETILVYLIDSIIILHDNIDENHKTEIDELDRRNIDTFNSNFVKLLEKVPRVGTKTALNALSQMQNELDAAVTLTKFRHSDSDKIISDLTEKMSDGIKSRSKKKKKSKKSKRRSKKKSKRRSKKKVKQ
jgi:hypothetical protein